MESPSNSSQVLQVNVKPSRLFSLLVRLFSKFRVAHDRMLLSGPLRLLPLPLLLLGHAFRPPRLIAQLPSLNFIKQPFTRDPAINNQRTRDVAPDAQARWNVKKVDGVGGLVDYLSPVSPSADKRLLQVLVVQSNARRRRCCPIRFDI